MDRANTSAEAAALERVWLIALSFFAICFAFFVAVGFQLPAREMVVGAAQLITGAVAALWLLRMPGGRKAGAMLSGWLQYAAISGGAAMLAFCAATLSRPLADPAMIAADRALGYDWIAYAQFVKSRPALDGALQVAYYSLVFQPLVICVVLPLKQGLGRLAEYELATLIGLIVTIVVFAALPVTTAWAYAGGGELLQAENLNLSSSEGGWVRQLMDIRAGGGRRVGWDIDARIVGFPSFHCAGALLNCWAVWNVRRLRAAAVALNLALIAATPLVGGHYLVDLFGGAIVMIVSVVLAKKLYRWIDPNAPVPLIAPERATVAPPMPA